MKYKTDNIELIRKLENMSYQELGNLIGVSKSTAHERLKKESPFKINELEKIAQHAGVTIDTLLYSEQDVFLSHYVRENNPKAG